MKDNFKDKTIYEEMSEQSFNSFFSAVNKEDVIIDFINRLHFRIKQLENKLDETKNKSKF